MPLKFNPSELKSYIETFKYSNFGDRFEREHENIVNWNFPNSEVFWKYFVSPMTNRIDTSITDADALIRPRNEVSLEIQDISAYHYSIFLNIVYANDCLSDKQMAFFENFYAHLATICDLTEEFLLQLHFLIGRCNDNTPKLFTKLSEPEFLDLSKTYYIKQYDKDYNFYFSKGKITPTRIISASNILDDYFGKRTEWKEYKTTTSDLKAYRNVVIHNKQLATLSNPHTGEVFVPKRKEIRHYKNWHEVFNVTQERFDADFTERKTQMANDLTELLVRLNNLWQKPIEDMMKLIYDDKNKMILELYNIDFTDTSLGATTFNDIPGVTPPDSGSTIFHTATVSNTAGSAGNSIKL
ncbi:MAG: hypothetical protein ACOVSR_01395 [Bacteroidia bacterium]